MVELVSVNERVYIIIIEADKIAGGYVAKCPVLKDYVLKGETKEQALKMIKNTIVAHLEVGLGRISQR